MIDFSLTEEQLMLQKTARDFAQQEVKSVAEEYEKKPDAAASVIPLDSDLFKKANELGFFKMLWPKEYGGSGLGELDLTIVLEEFAAADVGFAVQVNSLNTFSMAIFMLGGEEVRKKFLEAVEAEGIVLMGFCINEPDGGSEAMYMGPDPKLGMKTHARREGDEYIINGSKLAFSTGVGQARFINVFARTDTTRPQTEGTSLFFIPADTPGLSFGKVTDKICWRTVHHSELYLDEVRVPKEYLLGEEGKAHTFPPVQTIGLLGASCFSVGVARAAFEYVVDYAKQRHSWGQPIINHQAVAVTLADMEMEIDAARLMVRHAAWTNDHNRAIGEPMLYHSGGSKQKVFATEMGVRVVQKAMTILAAYSLTKEYPMERWMREALVGPITCWPNNIHRLQIAAAL